MPGFIITNEESSNNRPMPPGTADVARTHRWYVAIDDIGDSAKHLTVYAHTCSRPVMEQDQIVAHSGKTQINLPGKYRWLPITIRFYEGVENTVVTSNRLFEWRKKINDYSTHVFKDVASARSATGLVSLTDAEGQAMVDYQLLNLWPTKVEYTDLDYATSNLTDVTASLVYDWCDEKYGTATGFGRQINQGIV